MRASPLYARLALLLSLVLQTACTDPYLPEAIANPPNYLVVDGFINVRGLTTIRLSQTYAIASKAAPPVEARATIYIEDDAGARYRLSESVAGTYTTSQTLNAARNYRLHINTQGGKEYASDYVQAKITPPIDAVNWRAESAGLKISVNAHDATNATQYYRWETEETWEIVPNIQPQLEYVNRVMRPITTPFPRICWGNEISTKIRLVKTTGLTQDAVSDHVLVSLPTTTDRLWRRYSILVKQYAQTSEEYQYWDMLKKNTEDIGTLFDPLPTQLTGNVHCLSNRSEIALGYVGAYSEERRRIFITRNQLPFDWKISNGYESCIPDTVLSKRVQAVFGYPGNVPIYDVPGGFLGTTKDCVDCRTRGTDVRPSFW
jgi:hypothetical protein